MWTRWIWCVALLVVVAWRGVAAGAAPSLDGDLFAAAAASTTEAKQPGPSMSSAVNCMSSKLPVQCLERWAGRYRDSLVSEQQSFEARAQHPVEGKMAFSEAKRIVLSMLPGAKEKSDDMDLDIAPDDKGRGHKLKKKIHKIIKLIKIILFIVIVKLKMVFMMFMMQTAFQFKLVAITFMILLIKKYYLWVEWKHKKEEKKAVVYYEHAQHQHHYDESDHYHDGLGGLLGHGGQHGKDGLDVSGAGEPGGGWGGWWGKRSAEFPAPMVPAAGPAVGNPSDPALAAQRLAYNAHLQGGQPPLVG